MSDLALIADDLTGAADSGVAFAGEGFSTAIPLGAPRRLPADVLVLSTESRDVPPGEAERRVRAALTAAFGRHGEHRPPWLYKKMDSALRGHPALELAVTMALGRVSRALVAPAIPSQRRTTVGGKQLEDGVLLSETPMGRATGRADLVELFRTGTRLPTRSIDLATVRGPSRELRSALSLPGSWIAVADAETDEDLDRLALTAVAAGIRLYCGAAGLTGVLAERLPLHIVQQPPLVHRRPGPTLTIAGSQHAATAGQVAHLEKNGATVCRLTSDMIGPERASVEPVVAAVRASLAAGQATVVTTAGLPPSPLGGSAVAARLAEIAAAPGCAAAAGGLVLTGGDVAAAVCAALGVEAFWLRGSVLPAIPWSTLAGGALDGMVVATKAGSFGAEHALTACGVFLSGVR